MSHVSMVETSCGVDDGKHATEGSEGKQGTWSVVCVMM